MPTVARLTDAGELHLANGVNTRSPLDLSGLRWSMPLDGSLNKSEFSLSGCKALGSYIDRVDVKSPLYDILKNEASMTYVADLTTVSVATALQYDIVIFDCNVWVASSAVIEKLKEFTDAGVSCIAMGNDTLTNVFVESTVTVPGSSHDITMSKFGVLYEGVDRYPYGNGDNIITITKLRNGAIPEYYRAGTNYISGYSYTSPISGAVFIFDQEAAVSDSFRRRWITEALRRSKGRVVSTDVAKYTDGFASNGPSTNLYQDGRFKSKLVHPVKGGTWTVPDDFFGPDGQNVVRGQATGAPLNYNGRDIPATVGATYTMSCKAFVSTDANAGVVHLRCEERPGDGSTQLSSEAKYDLTRRGTWQYLTATFVATTAELRILGYALNGFSTGFVAFTDMRVDRAHAPACFAEGADAGSSFAIDFNPLREGTIVGTFKPFSGFPNSPTSLPSYTETPNQAALLGIHDTTAGGNAYYRYYQGVTGGSSPFVDPDGAYALIPNGHESNHVHAAYTLTRDELVYMVTITAGRITVRIYQNGQWKPQHSFMIGDQCINRLTFGLPGGTVWNGVHRDVNLYDRVLVPDEVAALIKRKSDIVATGLIGRQLTTHNDLPVDAIFFDLGGGARSADQALLPVEDSASYSQGVAYVGGGKTLEFNLYRDLKLDWTKDWSICYMKKPIGTHRGETDLTGYSIESLGSNENTVGTGYVYIGKQDNLNELFQFQNGAIDPAVYFDQWQWVSIVKQGTAIRIEVWLADGSSRVRTNIVNPTRPDFYVCQHGYDFNLGAWDGNGGCYTQFKNLLIAKRALTVSELERLRQVKLSLQSDNAFIQSNIVTGAVL